ncbi:hypothetical protein ACQKMD_20235 [Viridibacillus sp. NPDC096237]|uniref:hypothetical protein n=1 Tax=Viridibacillus sp. NPDC096237 TaxID=3390721 RepID=UPI003D0068D3
MNSLFVEAVNELEARAVTNKFLEKLQTYIIHSKVEKVETYWKIEGMYVVNLMIIWQKHVTRDGLEEVLSPVADKWIDLGDCLLASKNDEECTYLLEGIDLVNIYFRQAN